MFKKIKYSPTNNRGIIKTSRFLTMCGMKKIFLLVILSGFIFFDPIFVTLAADPPQLKYAIIAADKETNSCPLVTYQLYTVSVPQQTTERLSIPVGGTTLNVPFSALPFLKNLKEGELVQICLHKDDVEAQISYKKSLGTPNFRYNQISGYQMQVPIPCQPIAGGSCPSNYGSSPAAYIARLYQFGLMVAGLAAFGMLVYASLLYTLSAGSFASQEDAKKMMWNVLSGVLLLMGAYLILYTINPNLVSLRDPQMPTLDLSSLTSGDEGDRATKATAESHPLCQSGTYTGITAKLGISLNTSEGTKSKTLGADFICNECKSGASKTSIGDCACNPGYVLSAEGNKCFAAPTN